MRASPSHPRLPHAADRRQGISFEWQADHGLISFVWMRCSPMSASCCAVLTACRSTCSRLCDFERRFQWQSTQFAIFVSCTRHNFGVFYVFVMIVSVFGPYYKSSWELYQWLRMKIYISYYRLRDKPKYRDACKYNTMCMTHTHATHTRRHGTLKNTR